MNRFRFAVLVALTGTPAVASSPDPKDLAIPPHELSRARELVRGLGSEVYREREDAELALGKMGRLAKPVLSEAVTTDPDPEVRGRAVRLLAKAAADDLKARLDTFLADADGKFEHRLPGWEPFRKAVGTDKPARELFTDLVRSPTNLDLLTALELPAEQAGQAIADRRAVLYSTINRRVVGGFQPANVVPVQLTDIAALLLADTVVPAEHVPRPGQMRYVTGVSFFQMQPSLAALTTPGARHAEAYKRLVSAWLESRTDPNDLSSLIHFVPTHLKDMKPTPAVTRRIADTPQVTGWARAQATGILVRTHGEKEIPRLKEQLADNNQLTQVWLGNGGAVANGYSLLVRDVALAHLLTLSKQELKDYGFETQQGQAVTAMTFGAYAFPTPDARDAAFKKWAAWEKEQAAKNEKK